MLSTRNPFEQSIKSSHYLSTKIRLCVKNLSRERFLNKSQENTSSKKELLVWSTLNLGTSMKGHLF